MPKFTDLKETARKRSTTIFSKTNNNQRKTERFEK